MTNHGLLMTNEPDLEVVVPNELHIMISTIYGLVEVLHCLSQINMNWNIVKATATTSEDC